MHPNNLMRDVSQEPTNAKSQPNRTFILLVNYSTDVRFRQGLFLVNCDQVFPTPIGAMRSWGGYTLPPGIRSPPQCSGLVIGAKHPGRRRLPVIRRGTLVNIAYEQKRGGSECASPSGIRYAACQKCDRPNCFPGRLGRGQGSPRSHGREQGSPPPPV